MGPVYKCQISAPNASDRRQARAVFNYLKALAALPEFKHFVHRVLRERIELNNGCHVEVTTASYRSVRGFTIVACICDEIVFWRDEESANPDKEILDALRPAMATVPGAKLFALSNPYACKGELWSIYERYFGKDSEHVVIWNADTANMNPELPAYIIEKAFEEDPIAAASEYGREGRVHFRRNVEAFLDPVAVAAVTVEGRRELPPREGVTYHAFADPSGGSQDSFTLAIAHREGDLAVLDAVRERRPPFSPDSVVQEFANLLDAYGCRETVGDRYAGEWVVERFERQGIRYRTSERVKSDIYRELLPSVNAGNVALLDLPTLKAQLVGLERRVARGGRDSIDHGPGGGDDVANAVGGALVLALPAARKHRRRIQWA